MADKIEAGKHTKYIKCKLCNHKIALWRGRVGKKARQPDMSWELLRRHYLNFHFSEMPEEFKEDLTYGIYKMHEKNEKYYKREITMEEACANDAIEKEEFGITDWVKPTTNCFVDTERVGYSDWNIQQKGGDTAN